MSATARPPEPVLTIQQHKFVRGMMRVIETRAAQMRKKFPHLNDHDMEDLHSIGKIELYELVLRRDPAKSRTFEAYASLRVYGKMLSSIRLDSRRARIRRDMIRALAYRMAEYTDDFDILRHDEAEFQRRIDRMAASATGVMFAAGVERARLEAEAGDTAAREEHARAIEALGDAVRVVDKRDREMLALVYVNDFNLQDVAGELGITPQTAGRRLDGVLERLRRILVSRGVMSAPEPIPGVQDGAVFDPRPRPPPLGPRRIE